ncbi:site-specific integrase [Nocardiopsis terrae]
MFGLRSEHTREAYRRDLQTFHAWLGAVRGHTDLAVEVGDIEVYARHLREDRGEKRKTVARRLSTLSALYKRLMVTGHSERNPADPALVSRGDTRTADTPPPGCRAPTSNPSSRPPMNATRRATWPTRAPPC